MKKTNLYPQLLREGILKNFPCMFRGPEGPLKRPYLDPSGPYGKQLWDWDSFFASTALFGMLKDPRIGKEVGKLKDTIFEHTQGSLLNLFDHQAADGTIPTLLTVKSGDTFHCLEKNKGEETNMAKPVLGQFLKMIVDNSGRLDVAKAVFDRLLLFYSCYEKYYQDQPTGLFVWGSDVAIGVDDDPTTWARPNFSSANILLNCLLYADLASAAQIARRLGRTNDHKKLSLDAAKLKSAIQKYCWDQRDGFFYTVDVQCKRKTCLGWIHQSLEPFWHALPLKVMVWSGFLPLWANICTPVQAKNIVKKHLLDKEKFWAKYGVRALSKDEVMYQPEIARGNPSNWLGPIWIVTNYLVWKGLKNYRLNKEADELAKRIVNLLGQDMEKNGYLHEYYSPETGKGITGKNFWNWNNLVIFMLK
jgi:putative isomerase